MIIFKSHENLDIITPYLPNDPIIIEAGAFIGRNTLRLANHWPNATIYAFEPVNYLFKQLQDTTKDLPNVHCYKQALSDKNGTAQLYISERTDKPGIPNQGNSLHKPKERLKWSPLIYPRTIDVETITLNSWTQKNNVQHIDLLWLDVQGHAFNILQASTGILKRIKAIFSEVEFIPAYENQVQFQEIKQWLENHNFKFVAKNFENEESWFFGDALFIQK